VNKIKGWLGVLFLVILLMLYGCDNIQGQHCFHPGDVTTSGNRSYTCSNGNTWQ